MQGTLVLVLTVIHRRPFTKHVDMDGGQEEIFREGLGYRNRKIRLRPYFEKIDLLGSGKIAKIEYHDPFSHPNEALSHRSFWSRFYSLVRSLAL